MRKTLNTFLIIISAFFLISCDPPHSIDFINNRNSESKIKLIINPQEENYMFHSFDNIRYGDSLIFVIEKNETKTLHFGIGTWSKAEIKMLVKSLEQIRIENNDKLIVYKSKNAIKKLLNKDKEGFWWDTKINVQIE